jgi:two-component system sensor histidine kinase YesM
MNLAPRKIKLRSFLMILSNLISIVVIIIFSMLLYLSVSEYIHNNTDAINRSKFEYMLSVIERNYNEIINISNYIRSNKNLKTSILVFNDEKTLINNKLKALKYITNFLVGVKSQNRHIKSINIISRNNSSGVITEKRFYTLDYLISMGISKKLLKEEIDKILFCYPAWDDISSKVSVDDYLIKDMEKEIYVKFSFPGGNAHDASGNIKVSKDYGNVYIFLNNNFFREITAGRENLLILDSENKIIYNGMKKNNPNMKTGNIVDDLTASRLKNVRDLPSYNKDMGLYSKSLDNGWTLLYYFDKYGFFEKQERLKVVIFLLLAISFLCSFFLSNSLSKKILRPIKKLADFMSNYEYKGEKLEKCSPNQPGRKVTLRERIFCYFLLTIMLPVLLFMMLFNFRAIDLTNKEISAQFLNTFDKTGKYIDEYFGKKLMAFHNIIYDISMQEFIFNKKYNIETNSNYYKDINIIAEILRSYKYLRLENNEIRFYDNNKLVFSNQIN